MLWSAKGGGGGGETSLFNITIEIIDDIVYKNLHDVPRTQVVQ